MRKLFTTLKSIVVAALAVSMVGVTSCSYDDTDLKNRVHDLEQDVNDVKEDLATLEQRVADLEKKVSDEVAALKGLIKDQVVVSKVVEENGAVTVTLSDGTQFTVYPKANPTDTNTDTYISVKADEITGVYYWAIFNEKGFVEFLKVDGERVAVFQEQEDACEPVDLKFQVNEKGNIEFSVDGGKTWTDSGVAVGACDCEGTVVSTGACVFKNVVVRDHYVTFTLADGSEVVVFLAEFISFEAGREHFYVKPGEVKALPFVVNEQVEDISVMNQPMGWKASVELAEDQTEAEPSKAAYVLNIEGPSQYLVAAEVAEKTGYIQLHITTATGACKVVKVAVDLAEITLDVDAEGNVTIVNTWVDSYIYSSWMGDELIEEFNNYLLYAIPYDYYEMVEGDIAQLYNSSWSEFECEAYGGWINNIWNYINDYNEAPIYVNGEKESWTYNFTVEELVNRLSYGSAPYEGESFVIVVVPTDPQNNGLGNIDNAIVAEFKQLYVNVEQNADHLELADAYLDFKFKGSELFYVSCVEQAYIDEYLSYGYPSVQEALYSMLYVEWGIEYISWSGMPVAVLEGDFVEYDYSVNELFGYDLGFAAGTNYCLAVIPVAVDQTSVTPADIYSFSFVTAEPEYVYAETFKCNGSSANGYVQYTVAGNGLDLTLYMDPNYADSISGAISYGSYTGYYTQDYAYSNYFGLVGTYNGANATVNWTPMAVSAGVVKLEILVNGETVYVKYEGEIEGSGIEVANIVRAEVDMSMQDIRSQYYVWLYDDEGGCLYIYHYYSLTTYDYVVEGTYTDANGNETSVAVSKFSKPNPAADGKYYITVDATLPNGKLVHLSATQIPTTER